MPLARSPGVSASARTTLSLSSMAVLIASSLRKELSGDPLFDGVSFKVERRERLALAGPNGAGKTTLLRALIGETRAAGRRARVREGHPRRAARPAPAARARVTLREYALSGAADLVALEDELRRLERAMADGEHGPATMRRYGEAQARLEHAGGYRWRDRADAALRGLGFTDDDLERGLETFSGGELTRASLARALAGDPDLLLLDEPTNHLDMASIEWLERELSSIDAAVVLVAHDRWFLEAVGDRRARARRRRLDVLPRQLAPVAAGEGRPSAQQAKVARTPGGGDRAPRAVRRPLPYGTSHGRRSRN